MASHESDGPVDWEALARQYWGAWTSALREPPSAAAPAGEGAPDWEAMFRTWRELLQQLGTPGAEAAAEGLGGPAAHWFALMQQVASRFAGREASGAEIAAAWRQAVRGQEADWLRWLGQAGQASWDPWLERVSRWLAQWRAAGAPWLDLPGLGLGRNDHARWQRLADAQKAYQSAADAYLEQLRQALEAGFALFERRLAEHEAPGTRLDSVRALFDLWIDAAEEAYAQVALSPRFQQAHADFAHAQMRLRAAIQAEVERIAEPLGVPTRTEMDSAHRRITELERELRRLRDQLERNEPPPPPPEPRPRRRTRRTVPPAAPKGAAPRRPARRKPAP